MFFPPLCVCTRTTEEAARAGGETVCLIWIQALVPRGPVHCGPPRCHCNFISCRGDNECRVASAHQTPRPPVPASRRGARTRPRVTRTQAYVCAHACVNTETHSLTFRTLPNTFPHSSHPPPPPPELFFPLVGLWWAEGAGFLLGLSLPSRFRNSRAGKEDMVEGEERRRLDRL